MIPTGPSPIRYLVVDDDAFVRQHVPEYLAGDPELSFVGACSDGAEAVAVALADPPHVVLMDLQMPGMDGFTAMRRIRDAEPRTRVIALTNLDDEFSIARVLTAGGSACLPKMATRQQITDTIKAVVRHGLIVLPASAENWLGQRLATTSPFRLTERQLRILAHLAAGRPEQAILDAEHISRSTLKSDRRNLEDQLGVKGIPQLTHRARQIGLVT